MNPSANIEMSPELASFFDQADAALPPAAADPGEGSPDGGAPAATEKPTAAAAAPAGTPAPGPAQGAPNLQAFETRFAELKAQEAKLAERDTALKSREAAQPSLEAFRADPIGELRRLARLVVGDDDAKVSQYLSDQVYEELTMEILGAKDPDKLDPGIKNRMELRRLNRSLDAEKQAREAMVKEQAQKEETRLQTEKLGQVKAGLSRWHEANGRNYPHFSTFSANPAEDLFQIMVEDPTLDMVKASEVAEKHYRAERERFSKPLPGARPTPTAAGPRAKEGEPAPVKGARPSLMNSGATEGMSSQDAKPPDDPEASREYWAEMMERDPDKVAALSPRRR